MSDDLIGKKVRRKDGPQAHVIATIKHQYNSIPGGVILDRKIEGFRSWNIDKLVFVEDK